MPVTIYDIARKANVSHSTVSRVLSGKGHGKRRDSIERARLILEVAAAEGYQPNNAARSLVNKQSRNICFLMSDQIQSGWANAYFAQLLDGVEQACQEHNYGLIINRFCGDDFDSFFTQRRLGGREFDGIVIAGDVSHDMRRKFDEYQLPFVTLDHTSNNLQLSDEEQTRLHALLERIWHFETVRYAYKKGHRHIGFIFHDSMADAYQKLLAARDQANATDCIVTPIYYNGRHDFSSGEAIMEKILEIDASQRPSLISVSYQSCIALMKAMKTHGINCPDDISLISDCDSEACAVVEPGLTVVSLDQKKRGYIAAMALIAHFGENISLEGETCATMIVERQSVKDLSSP
jgi:DNA-binding LacI/PurR family transcriptional regulator